METDLELIEKIKRGEKEFYELIVKKYNQRLYRITRAMIVNESEIEDIMQDTFLKAYQYLHQFEGKSEFSTWLIRILINQANGVLNKKKKFAGEEERKNAFSKMESSNNPEQSIMNNELKRFLEQAIDALPEKYKIVYMMREVEALSSKKIANSLDLTEENVRIRLYRAKTLLKDSLYQKSKGDIELFRFMNDRCDRITRKVMSQIQRQN